MSWLAVPQMSGVGRGATVSTGEGEEETETEGDGDAATVVTTVVVLEQPTKATSRATIPTRIAASYAEELPERDQTRAHPAPNVSKHIASDGDDRQTSPTWKGAYDPRRSRDPH